MDESGKNGVVVLRITVLEMRSSKVSGNSDAILVDILTIGVEGRR